MIDVRDPFDPDQAFTIVYDAGDGEVVVNNFGVKEAITVRQSMVDSAVRHAAIVELERLGYLVIPPGEAVNCGLCFPGDLCKEHS